LLIESDISEFPIALGMSIAAELTCFDLRFELVEVACELTPPLTRDNFYIWMLPRHYRPLSADDHMVTSASLTKRITDPLLKHQRPWQLVP